MKIVALFSFLFTIQICYAQEFQPFEIWTAAGYMTFDENYFNSNQFGHKKVDLVHTSKDCVDLYAWSWQWDNFNEIHFEKYYNDIWLVRTKHNKIIQTLKVLKYDFKK